MSSATGCRSRRRPRRRACTLTLAMCIAQAAVFVAETPAGVVGRLSIARDNNPFSYHVAELGLMVAATERRRGIGTALMEEGVKWARSAGITKVELHVFPHNEPAIALYKKLGSLEEAQRPRHHPIAGRRRATTLMATYPRSRPTWQPAQ